MQGKYRKIMVEMKREIEDYQLWHKVTKAPICYVESYKDKRAVFFHGYNLIPGEKYHVILIGSDGDEMHHQDFGPFHTGSNGDLRLYKTFSGPDLSAYIFCIFCADRGEGNLEIIYKGKLAQEEKNAWEALCSEGKQIEVFTTGQDETEAEWFRVEAQGSLPGCAKPCLPWVTRYRHYIIGRKKNRYYLGVPGRFLQKEQPLREEKIFLLWQPLRGGEAYFDKPDQMTPKQQEEVFGYWIAEVNVEEDRLQSF